jgi:hypothetical protein
MLKISEKVRFPVGFDIKCAQSCASYSLSMFDNMNTDVYMYSKYNHRFKDDESGVEVFISIISDRIHITFKALKKDNTSTVVTFNNNVLKNKWLKGIVCCFSDKRVGQSYTKEYMKLRDRILSVLSDTDKAIYVSGFGIGGGVAMICAYDLRQLKYDDISVYTFGARYSFNKSFCKAYNKLVPDTYQVRYFGDRINNDMAKIECGNLVYIDKVGNCVSGQDDRFLKDKRFSMKEYLFATCNLKERK